MFNNDKQEDKLPENYAWTLEDLPKDIGWLSNIKFSVKDVRKIIRKITSMSSGPSGISPLLLKKTEGTMGPIIWRWCKTVLEKEELPSINVLSYILTLLKLGKNPGDPASYRPVALTERLVRILEKLLQKHMQEHAERFNLFSEAQHRFRSKPSTISNILKSQQKIFEELIKGKTVDNIFLDLLKAFDKVSTVQLVRRLKRCGFQGKVLQFCRNFSEGRKQSVIANGKVSEEKDVTSGKPQRACLSPLFFCLYISPVVELLDTYSKEEAEAQKNLPEKHKRRNWKHMFADDTKLSRSLTEEKDIDSLQKYLDITLSWMEKMGMTVNGD